MQEILKTYKEETEAELHSILRYWAENTVDTKRGGFIGRITHDEKKHPEAAKGSVLNSRILWSFSAAYNLTKEVRYLQLAQRAYAYLTKYFIDDEYGGLYWTLTSDGEPLDTKKQIYALSFAVYGLSEYYKATEEESAKQAAIKLYNDIVKNSYDKVNGGYAEAFSRDWKEAADIRLSAKDAAERKSTNTHLHVLEGFANLYRIWPDDGLKQKLVELVRLFLAHMILKDSHHLRLFFEDDWTSRSNIVSYGHDIEAAWLIQDVTEIIGDEELLREVKRCSVLIANAAAEALDDDGGLWYEYDAEKEQLVKEKHWWPQAEAMVGFFNAWQITCDETWLQRSLNSWNFIKRSIKDESGEWKWGVYEDNSTMNKEDKVGMWKCPYHNGRACIEIIHRIDKVLGAAVETTTAMNKANN